MYSPQFYKLFDYVEMSTFDSASDAFATFKVCEISRAPRKSLKLCEEGKQHIGTNLGLTFDGLGYIDKAQGARGRIP